MRYLPFSFKQLKIVGVYGWEGKDTSAFIFELDYQNSNQFIICHIPNGIKTEYWLADKGLNVADTRGVIRNNCIHHRLPDPELTKADYINIIKDIKSAGIVVDKNTYVVYAVNLESGRLGYDIIRANDISEARYKARTYLETLLDTRILIKNLMLDPVKNSDVGYTYNLSNSYIGNCLFYKNSYRGTSKFMVGIFKPTLNISKCKQNYDWLDTCR